MPYRGEPRWNNTYGWARIPEINRIFRHAFEAAMPRKVHYIDALEISRQRIDRHKAWTLRFGCKRCPPVVDCLHYCLPGPPDDWSLVLKAIVLRLHHHTHESSATRANASRAELYGWKDPMLAGQR